MTHSAPDEPGRTGGPAEPGRTGKPEPTPSQPDSWTGAATPTGSQSPATYPPSAYPPAPYPPAPYPPTPYPPAPNPSTSYPPAASPPVAYPPAYPSAAYPGAFPPASNPYALPPAPAPYARQPAAPWITRADGVFAGIVIATLAVVGIAAGALWSAISPHSRGGVVSKTFTIPDETEQFVSGDGRFLIITAVIGLVAGAAAWALRRYRGPVAAAALGVGGTVGALITAGTGRLFSSGTDTGPVNTVVSLPVSLHSHGLVAVEGGLALAVYLLGTLFVKPDDLGRTETPTAGPNGPAGRYGPPLTSVQAGGNPDGVYGNRHGTGVAQDGQLPPHDQNLGA